MESMFGYFTLAIGVYLLYCGVTGKGQLYRNENVKKGMEKQYFKRMRMFAFVLGPIMLAQGAVDLLSASRQEPWLLTVSYVLFGMALAGLVVLFVITLRLTDRKKASGGTGRGAKKPSAPRAAFEFDDEEKEKKE